VSFKFPDQHDYTLRDVSVSINSGERLLITGTNGSGKSTLLTIIAGLYSVQKGSVSYNNLPKGNLILSTLHSVIGDYLTQQEELFEGTVMENIRMGRDAATYEHVKWAVDNLGLTDFIQSLPLGYDTIFDAQAKRLPRSVVQKMLIARAIADRPSLLLLEDAFEHLDEFERRRIIDFLTEKDKTWTVVVVSNDPYMAQRSDRLVVMKEGKVAAIGTYEEIKKSGTLKSERNA